MALTFTDDNFQEEVLSAKGVVLVDFWATWCGPCKMLTPIIEELHSQYEGKAKIGKVNVDENQDTAAKYGVMSIPTVLIFKDGKIAEQMVGYQPKENFETALNKHI